MAGEKLINAQVANLLSRAIAEVGANATRTLLAFAAGAEIGAKGEMGRIHQTVATDVRTAVRTAYEKNVEAVRLTPAYTRFQRRSGYLSRVLDRSDLARGDANGIEFVNTAALDTEAAHWRRLNFGAGQNAGSSISEFPLRLFGQTLAVLEFGIGPSAPFTLPPGFFGNFDAPNKELRGRGTIQPFYPAMSSGALGIRKSPYQPSETSGIRGRHFLEEGLAVMATELPIMYEDMINGWIQKGGRKAKAIQQLRTVRG